jgi:ADP-ribose pyrophosphatase
MAERKDVEVRYEGKFIRFLQLGEWEFVQRHNCSGIVIIVALTNENNLIFVDQHRPPVDGRVIEFPAGLIGDEADKSGESLIEGAKRELLEETGYAASTMTELLRGPVSGGSSADFVTMFRAGGLRKVSQGGGNEEEDIIVHEIPLSYAHEWLRSMSQKGYFIEPKIYAGLYFLQKELGF